MAVNVKKDFGNNTPTRKPDMNAIVYGKIPPQAPDLEEAVLGVLLLEKDKFDVCIPILHTSDCFYVDANQKIYAVMIEMRRQNIPIDHLTVAEYLRQANELEIIGGAYYLMKLVHNVVSGAHIETHARLVKEKYIAREVIRIAGIAIGAAYENHTDVFDMANTALHDLEDILHNDIGGTVHMAVAAKEALDEIIERKNAPSTFNGIDTGVQKLNEITNGWQKTDLIILAARPSVGKTALGLTFSYAAASSTIAQGASGPGLFFSYEMPRKQLAKRLLSSNSEVPLKQLQRGNITDNDLALTQRTAEVLSRLPFFINDNAALNIDQLVATLHTYKKKHKIQWAIIDYLQLIPSTLKGGNREQEVSDISRKLKRAAKALEIPIIALAQINRGIETRAAKEPMTSDLRESGAIEQDADVIMMIYTETNEGGQLKHKIKIGKHRNGETDTIELQFVSAIQKWQDATLPWHSLSDQNAKAGFTQMHNNGYNAYQKNNYSSRIIGEGNNDDDGDAQDLPF